MAHSAAPSRQVPDFLIGGEWLLDGILKSEAGINLAVASRTDPVPGMINAFRRYAEAIDAAGISLQMVEDDEVAAGLVRAGIGTGRHVLAIFDIRGFLRAFSSIVELTRTRMTERDAIVLAICESRWRDLLDDSAPRKAMTHVPPPAGSAIDFRRVAEYLALPVLAPSTPPEVTDYLNEAVRLSRSTRLPVAMLLSPALVGGAESVWSIPDPTMRAVPTRKDDSTDAEIDPLLREARRRQIDRVLNAPVPGERAPIGFITTGTAHAALRHALNLLGVSGRCPILKIGLTHPVDPHSLHQFLLRCDEVIVVEAGDRLLEEAVCAEAQNLLQRKLHCASVRSLISSARESTVGPIGTRTVNDQELHPTRVLKGIAPLLRSHATSEPARLEEAVAEHMEMCRNSITFRPAQLPRRTNSTARNWAGLEPTSLVRTLMDSILTDLAEELLLPQTRHPSIRLRVTTADSCSFEMNPNERMVVLVDRRRLATLGRSIIAHAIRRRQAITFLVVPGEPPGGDRMRTGEADRMIRGMIADAESPFATVGTVDPGDGGGLRETIRREVLADVVSILIVDTEPHVRLGGERRKRGDKAAQDDEVQESYTEHHVVPFSAESHLHLEWMIRRGYVEPNETGTGHSPRVHAESLLGASRASVLEAWDGFLECRIRHRAPTPTDGAEASLPSPKRLQHAGEAFWRAHLCGRSEGSVRQACRLLAECAVRMGFRVQAILGRDRTSCFAQLVFSRPYPGRPPEPITPRIPFGGAHLLLALDPVGLASATRHDHQFQVASAASTRAVVFPGTARTGSFSGTIRADGISRTRDPGHPAAVNDSDLTALLRARGLTIEVIPVEQLAAHVAYRDSDPGDVAVGFAFQRGWIPATVEALGKAALIRPSENGEKGIKTARPGLLLGRQLAELSDSNLPVGGGLHSRRPGRTSGNAAIVRNRERMSLRVPEQTIRRHAFVMSRRFRFHARRRAEAFETMAHAALDAMTGLRRHDDGRGSERTFVDRLIDCEIWGGLAACQDYNDLVQRVYKAENALGEYDVTRMVIPELARAMIVTDAAFVCATFARPDVRRWLQRLARFGVDSDDDFTFRLRGRVHARTVRALIGPYWKFTPMTANAVRHLRWLRRFPFIRGEKKRNRDWVIGLVQRCAADLPEKRSVWIEVFRQFERVHGPWPNRERRIRGVRMAIQSLLDISDSERSEGKGPSPAPSATDRKARSLE